MMKENIFNYLKNNIIMLVISFILFLISIFEFVYFYKNDNNETINSYEDDSLELKEEVIEENIIVDIKGEIKKPGVYNIKVGSRVNDLINEAGGLSKNANTRFINLSKKLEDGEVVVIYSNKEISDAEKNDKLEVSAPCVCEEVKNDACYNDTNSSTSDSSKIVNINTASAQELTILNGIGESKAKAIVNYREKNGKFKTIKDIMNVSGISETLFSKIKDNITV